MDPHSSNPRCSRVSYKQWDASIERRITCQKKKCCNMDEHWKHTARKKPLTKAPIVYDCIYMKLRIGKPVETDSICPGPGGESSGKWLLKGMRLPFFKKILFIFWERGGEGEREGEKHQLVASRVSPTGGLGLQPGHVPWLGIKLATFQFAGQCSIHWATPATACVSFCDNIHITWNSPF